jgi:hypothetical protein
MDRYRITDNSHPWYGEIGTLTDNELPTGQLVLMLENGMSCGVYMRQVAKL